MYNPIFGTYLKKKDVSAVSKQREPCQVWISEILSRRDRTPNVTGHAAFSKPAAYLIHKTRSIFKSLRGKQLVRGDRGTRKKSMLNEYTYTYSSVQKF